MIEATDRLDAPAVSVVVPTFQRREYVQRAVASVLAQTYEDFELIVADDGSTDGTREALTGLDPRIRYEWQENRGVAAARNLALRLARGEIVAFLDSDDRWLPNHLSIVTDVLARHPEAVLVSTCPGYRLRGAAPSESAQPIDLLPSLLLGSQIGYVPCVAVRREALLVAGSFDERLPVWEDIDLWLRLSILGPFCLLGHRTVECQTTAGGLKQRGISSGAYLEAIDRSARTAEEALLRIERPDIVELKAHARAEVRLVDGVRAIVSHDSEAARSALAEAYYLAPALSRKPGQTLNLLRHTTLGPGDMLPAIVTTASLLPDRNSDTVRYLWAYAFVLALRARRFRQAATYLHRSSVFLNPGVLVRTRALSARLIRNWLHSRTDHPPENAAVEVGS